MALCEVSRIRDCRAPQLDITGGITDMSEYQVTLLGIPGVFNNGRIVHFPYRKAEGIFYYLCVEKKVNRDELISVFWGSSDESSGRKNLRQALFQIRRCLDKDAILLHGKNSLELNPKFGFGSEWDLPEADFALRQDRFLDFFYLKDCPEFEVWVENKRRIQLSRCLDYIKSELAEPLVCRDITRLRRLIGTWEYWKPWDEEMVLTGMKCYMQAEKYDWGIQMYHEYVKCLRRDLDRSLPMRWNCCSGPCSTGKKFRLSEKRIARIISSDGWRSFNTLMNGFSGS